MDPRIYWVWLSLSLTPATDTFRKLYEHVPDAKGIYDLDDATLTRLLGSTCRDAQRLGRKDLTQAERVLTFCLRKNIGIVTFEDAAYPPLLKNIPDPPVLLYYRGTLPDFAASFPVAVVGTRHMTSYGRKSAFHISFDLARAGATVVSGMANGIDGVAHAAAIAAGGTTVAVLGCGIDICYPKAHLTLARSIVGAGCVMTEYAPATPPLAFHFPQRNRIISGLCAATLVMEGREKSGSLITARCAMAQGRAVYALPGNVDESTSEVTALLLKNGAHALTSADDVIRDFEFVYTGILNPYRLSEPVSVSMEQTLSRLQVGQIKEEKTSRRFLRKEAAVPDARSTKTPKDVPLPTMTEEERGVYESLPADGGVCDVESLVNASCTLRTLMRVLLSLEIKGCVELHPGERVSRK